MQPKPKKDLTWETLYMMGTVRYFKDLDSKVYNNLISTEAC